MQNPEIVMKDDWTSNIWSRKSSNLEKLSDENSINKSDSLQLDQSDSTESRSDKDTDIPPNPKKYRSKRPVSAVKKSSAKNKKISKNIPLDFNRTIDSIEERNMYFKQYFKSYKNGQRHSQKI